MDILNHPALSMLRQFEGFRSSPYWDVNAYRTGYGSDTITTADGRVVPVVQGMNVSRDDAERDLARRVQSEFMPSAVKAVGADKWATLTPAQQGALTSLAYNYGAGAWNGSLAGVANAVRGGSPEDAARAIQGLGSHNDGINRKRRNSEASYYLGGPLPAERFSSSNSPNQAIADDTMRALGMDPIQQDTGPRGVLDFLTGDKGANGERSYLGGWLTPDRRDRIIMALQGMTLNPNQGIINAASDRMQSRDQRKADTEKQNRTLAALQQMGASPEIMAIAQIDPALALRSQVNQSQANSDPRVQSTQILPDGSVVGVYTNGETFVKSPTGETLTGQAAADAVRSAQEFGASIQGDRSYARGQGANQADMETGEQAGAANSLGGERGKMVTSAFDQADVAASSINNIQTAINAIDEGAQSGLVYNMLPNITEASATLKNSLDKMGLDVIGSVTFGALSQAELNLAMETAAPRNLQPPELRAWLVKKLEAQRKVRVALMEQAQFLSDPNNTLNDWANLIGGGKSAPAAPSAPQMNDNDPLGIR